MQTWLIPKSLKSLRGFLGLTRYYCKFFKDYRKIAAPLTTLLKMNTFTWSVVVEESFQHLKMVMCSTPVLAIPNFSKTFIIDSDTFKLEIGVILMQEGWPLAFTSKALSRKNLINSTYEKQILTIIHVIQLWISYLIGHCFVIRTYHHSLKHFLE